MPILAPTGDDIARQGEPAWTRKERGYAPQTGTRELLNLATDPSQKNTCMRPRRRGSISRPP
jgi:hypothetical protein